MKVVFSYQLHVARFTLKITCVGSDKWLDEEPNTVIVIKVGQKSSTFEREEHRKRIRRKNWRKGYLRDLDIDGKTIFEV